jgi:hypothetical protein
MPKTVPVLLVTLRVVWLPARWTGPIVGWVSREYVTVIVTILPDATRPVGKANLNDARFVSKSAGELSVKLASHFLPCGRALVVVSAS